MLDFSNQFSEEIEKHFVRLSDNQDSIENALKSQYSNGPLEGTNNKIKVLNTPHIVRKISITSYYVYI
ncbi:transposase [Lactiplantibacillus sp. DA1]|uniref:transposase n=1 Tax=Lactiplantibacillus sp. DA1 TaxID=3079857 RepID=UPI0037C101F7